MHSRTLGPVLVFGGLGLPEVAQGMDCADLDSLVSAGVAPALLVEAVRSASPRPSEADMTCLAAKGRLDPQFLDELRRASGLPVIERPASSQGPARKCDSIPVERNCIGGVCLGDSRQTQASPAPILIGEKFGALRDIEVCGGQVVGVTVTRVFQDPGSGFDWSDVGPAQTGGVDELALYHSHLIKAVRAIGYLPQGEGTKQDSQFTETFSRTQLDLCAGMFIYHYRSLTIATPQNGGKGAMVALSLLDPNYSEKCVDRDTSGLR